MDIKETKELLNNYKVHSAELNDKIRKLAIECLISIAMDILNKTDVLQAFVTHHNTYWFADKDYEIVIWEADLLHNTEASALIAKDLGVVKEFIELLDFVKEYKVYDILKPNLIVHKTGLQEPIY